jgi:putative transposase
MTHSTSALLLSADELGSLTALHARGSAPARTLTRARVLDLLHQGQHPRQIAETLRLSVATIYNIKRRYLAGGLDQALYDQPRPGKPSTIDGSARAHITALACSTAPEGHARWTLRLLADQAVELGIVEQISHTAVRHILKKTSCNRT